MRSILPAACVLASVGTASAQDGEPRPFLSAEPSFRATSRELTGAGTTIGLDLTVGTRGWRAVQPIFHGGRLLDVTPADLIRRSIAPGFAKQTSTWYGAAGVRFLPPKVGWFQPYAEGTGGVARMDSEVDGSTGPFHVKRVVPLANIGLGAELRLGPRFTIDAGYRFQSFFGDANVGRRGPRLGFGVRF
ncbi:MAG TPA: hypothetical protein VGQ37_22815 [Vicinamibacterales bacterium]|jgi:hypothetical protein|nr:hypothetical protein [Vicinamibacterales bacterium]